MSFSAESAMWLCCWRLRALARQSYNHFTPCRAQGLRTARAGAGASRYELLRVLVLFVVHVHVELFGVVIPLAEIVLVVGLVVLVLEQRVRIRVGQER